MRGEVEYRVCRQASAWCIHTIDISTAGMDAYSDGGEKYDQSQRSLLDRPHVEHCFSAGYMCIESR